MTEKGNFTSLLKFTVTLKGQNSGTSRKKKNIEKILNIENKLHLQISLLLGAMLSVVCTVKIEFSSELISQIRGVILYLADSEHDLLVSQSVFTITKKALCG